MRGFGIGNSWSFARRIGGGGGITEPSGFVAKYTAYIVDNFTLDGSNITQWDDESDNNNNITQATSANQFTLIQDANIYNNVVRSDATDDNMTPLPTTTGDFAMQFKKKANTLATTKVLFSSSTTSAEVRLSADNVYEVVSDGGTVYAFNAIKSDSTQEVNIINRLGDSLELYDSVGYKETLDVTGESFTFDRVSDTANASDSDWQEIRIYDDSLAQNDVDYFYYLRNENNEISDPPLLPDPNQVKEFIFTVKTDNAGGVSANNQMTIGTISTGVYDCTVDWGDGNSDVITTWDDPAWTHTYSVVGTYVITISGTSFTYPYFVSGDDTKVINVSKWGLTDYGTTAQESFSDCTNLTLSSSDIPDTSSCTNLLGSWRGCSSLTSFPLIDTSSVTNIRNTWFSCSSLTSFPLIDTSSVTNMSSAWQNCSSLTSFPLIDTISVTNMSSTWNGCSSLTSFPLIETSSVTNMSSAWNDCSSLTSFPLIDTSSVTTMSSAWQNCSSLTSFPLIDTSSVTTMNSAWFRCSSLTSFPLIDMSSVTTMSSAWQNCSSLTSFPLIDTGSVISLQEVWRNCSSLTGFPLIDTSSCTNLLGSWRGCSSLISFPLIDTSSVTNIRNTWNGCSSLTSFPLIDVSSCTDFTNTWITCALNSDSIDNIMQALVNGGKSNLSTDISGGTNLGFSSWSAGAVANYNTLISRGWTITTNP